MKPWRTELIPQKSSFGISHSDRLFTLGSCFAQAIGKQLNNHKFQVEANPFGKVYNPFSIHKTIDYILRHTTISTDDFTHREEAYFHFDFHSQNAATSADALKMRVEELIQTLNEQLTKATVLILTYGTAFVYRRKDNQKIVANCHKVPSSNFTKELLTVDAVISSFHDTFQRLRKLKPSLKVVLTVSPVRHVKDTLELNAVSKSILRLACNQLSQQPGVEYFPAYELMMDDLRDYRFYKADRIHPTEEAEEYVWEKFADAHFNDSTKSILQEWHEVKVALHHRPLFPETASHQKFLRTTLTKLQNISPLLDVASEMAELKSHIGHA
jgi:GSCFA family